METKDIVMDLRIWVVSAIVLSLVLDIPDIPSSTLIIVALIIQMTLSMDGLKLDIKSLAYDRRGMLLSIFLCYFLNTLMTLVVGLLYYADHKAIWYGWVMLASMPCAISVVTAAILMKGDLRVSVIAVTSTYVAGIVLTPLISFALIGDAVNPFEILKYIILFIILPLILSKGVSYLHLKREVKVPVINMMLGMMLFLSVSANRGFIQSSPELVLLILATAIFRVLALHIASAFVCKRIGIPKDKEGVYLVLGVWKNTGLSVSMSMVILVAIPEAVIPCFMSMIVESVWFSIVTREKKAKEPVAIPAA